MNEPYSWKHADRTNSFERNHLASESPLSPNPTHVHSHDEEYIVSSSGLGEVNTSELALGHSTKLAVEEENAATPAQTQELPCEDSYIGMASKEVQANAGHANTFITAKVPGSGRDVNGDEASLGNDPSAAIGPRKPLAKTKRAAQNRSSQRTFRQRRDKYIKELEATALRVIDMQKTIDQLRQENLQLREYTMELQAKLMEMSSGNQSELPSKEGVWKPAFL